MIVSGRWRQLSPEEALAEIGDGAGVRYDADASVVCRSQFGGEGAEECHDLRRAWRGVAYGEREHILVMTG